MKMTLNRSIVLGFALSFLLAVAGPAPANNLAVTNTALAAPADGKVAVRFDLSWENSWRDGVNHDACWVFVKYSTDGGTRWSHATLKASGINPAGATGGTGTGLEIIVPADKKGAFIRRSAEGTGAISNTGVTLGWDFAADGVSPSKSALVKVFAIEMVNIPEGGFWAGNSNRVISSSFRDPDNAALPVRIDSTNAFDLCWETGDGVRAEVPHTFPNGVAGFYLMKTEISQRQYCDFLNTLAAVQQGNRHSTPQREVARYFIKKTSRSPALFGCDANGNAGPAAAVTNAAALNEANDGEWVACNYLSWADGAAYADWAALRPFTELEFEKACRGPLPPVGNEYAWGDAVLEPTTRSLNGAQTDSETPNRGNCNFNSCNPVGPYRCGSYANAGSSRAQAGAGYYGALDLSGNLWERTVSVGHRAGLAFTGAHGDGALDADGNANVALWPGPDAVGAGYRGGNYAYKGSVYARVADRDSAGLAFPSRLDNGGWRGARSAPAGTVQGAKGGRGAIYNGGAGAYYAMDALTAPFPLGNR